VSAYGYLRGLLIFRQSYESLRVLQESLNEVSLSNAMPCFGNRSQNILTLSIHLTRRRGLLLPLGDSIFRLTGFLHSKRPKSHHLSYRGTAAIAILVRHLGCSYNSTEWMAVRRRCEEGGVMGLAFPPNSLLDITFAKRVPSISWTCRIYPIHLFDTSLLEYRPFSNGPTYNSGEPSCHITILSCCLNSQ